MKITEYKQEFNKANHRWWHFVWGVSVITRTNSKAFSDKWNEHVTRYCNKPGCGWEKTVLRILTPESIIGEGD